MSSPAHLVLYKTDKCTHCVRVRSRLAKLQSEAPFTVLEKDINDPELRQEFIDNVFRRCPGIPALVNQDTEEVLCGSGFTDDKFLDMVRKR